MCHRGGQSGAEIPSAEGGGNGIDEGTYIDSLQRQCSS